VLLLHPSSGANLLSAVKIHAELQRQSPERLEIYDASLITGRPIDQEIADRYGDYLRSTFPDGRVDLAVVVGGAALRLYQRYRLQLFPSTPLLAIAAMRSVEPRVLSVRSKLNPRHAVQVSIEDTGIGIDPANLHQIFNALFTTKQNGMGMGLSICRSIIESHDGRISVSPGVNGGSIFQFELPTKVDKDKVSPMTA
jgi:hypothetical protein